MKQSSKKGLLILAMFFIASSARLLWHADPGVFRCLLFWAAAAAFQVVCLIRTSRVGCGIGLAGILANAIATMSNGGFMPVLGETTRESVWVPLTAAHRLPWLCDVFWGWSVGDLLLITGMVVAIVSGVLSISKEKEKVQ